MEVVDKWELGGRQGYVRPVMGEPGPDSPEKDSDYTQMLPQT